MFASEYKSGLDCNVLVLNKHYMAIRIVGAKRAFSLLFRELAEVVSLEEGRYSNYDFQSWCEVSQFRRQFEPDGHDWVSTVNFHIAVPRIIRLLFYDRLPRTDVKFNRRNILLVTKADVSTAAGAGPPANCHLTMSSPGVWAANQFGKT